VAGEVFVSGDYESATDNLNTHVQKFILRKVLDRASSVPEGIKELALSSLSMRLSDSSGKIVDQQRGQLMGNLISFPLLCLVNFLAFKFFVRRHVPLRINGDDIVFRASPREAKEWMDGVQKTGLVLSKGKTMVDGRFFSLNSCFFEARRKRVSVLPFVRSGAFFGKVEEGVISLRDRFRDCFEGFVGTKKKIINRRFLMVNHRFVLASRRSVNNGLGIRADSDLLRSSGLYNREICYLEPTGAWLQEVPLADVVKQVSPYRIEGWSLEKGDIKSKVVKDRQKEHSRLVRDEIWTVPVAAASSLQKSKKELIKESGKNVGSCGKLSRTRVVRFARLSGCSNSAAGRFLNKYRALPPAVFRPKGFLWWCPTEERSRSIVFLSSGFTS